MSETDYRILKLKSGEELITKIVGQKKDKMILERPMIFKSLMYQDEFGRKKELTVLKNWLNHSIQNITEIPKDHIATFLEPESVVVDLYNLEKEKEDTEENPPKQIAGPNQPPFPFFPPPVPEEPNDMKKEDMMSFLDAMNDMLSDMKDNVEDIQDDIEGDMTTEERDFVVMNILFPPSFIEELVERGIIKSEDLLSTLDMFNNQRNPAKDNKNDGIDDVIEERSFSDEDTSNETDREDFGSKWTDWNLEDLI